MSIVRSNEYYLHFKGTTYRVWYVLKSSETSEEMVVYGNDYEPQWVRPLSMWFDVVDDEGRTRFTKVDPV